METRTKIFIGLAVAAYFLFSRKARADSSSFSTTGAGTGPVQGGAAGGPSLLNQGDLRWKNKFVGNSDDSSATYGKIGCVTTCVTIATNMLKGANLTPDQLQPGRGLLLSSDYAGGSINSDQALERLGLRVQGRIRSMTRTPVVIAQMRALIDDTLAKGGVAILRVDYDLSTAKDNHSIVCFAKDPSGYKCVDPAGGIVIALDGTLAVRRKSDEMYFVNGVQPVFKR